jgi:hypothetical protein
MSPTKAQRPTAVHQPPNVLPTIDSDGGEYTFGTILSAQLVGAPLSAVKPRPVHISSFGQVPIFPHYETPKLSSEQLARLHTTATSFTHFERTSGKSWKWVRGYEFIDEAIALHEAMGRPEPIWYGRKPEEKPLNWFEMYRRFYVKRLTDTGEIGCDPFRYLLEYLAWNVKRVNGPAQTGTFSLSRVRLYSECRLDEAVPTCTTSDREDLYAQRSYMLAKWRKSCELSLWCEPGPDVRLLAENASRCVHGVLSFGQTTVGQLIESQINGKDVLIDKLVRGDNGEVLMCFVGTKGADHSPLLCEACRYGYPAWEITRKPSRGLAKGTQSEEFDGLIDHEPTTKEVCVTGTSTKSNKLVFDKPKSFETRYSKQLYPRLFDGSIVSSGPLQATVAQREQKLEDFFGLHNPIFTGEYREELKEEYSRKYLDLLQPPRNGLSFVPPAASRYRLHGPLTFGDYSALSSEPEWLTRRHQATRYARSIVGIYRGKKSIAHESLWCKQCLDYVEQSHVCPQPANAHVKHLNYHKSTVAENARQKFLRFERPATVEAVRLSNRSEFAKALRLVRPERNHHKALVERAKHAILFFRSVQTDNPIDKQLDAEIRMGLVHQNELLNGGKRVNTASKITDRLEKEDWSIGTRRTWQGEGGWDHFISDSCSRDRLHKRTPQRSRLENKFSNVTHCESCGRRFAGRKGQVCCAFDCAVEKREVGKKQPKGVKRDDNYEAVTA